MTRSNRSQFLLVELLLIIFGFAVAAQVSPPDPFTQIVATLVILVVTLPLSYWVAYKRA